MDDKFVNGTMLNNFAKKLKSNIKSDLLGDKKLRYLTQAEYDALTDDEKNDENIIYNITDANIEELFSGDYNDLENKPCYDTREFETISSPVVFNGDLTDKTVVETTPYYYVKISDTVPVVNGELFTIEMTMFDASEGEVTRQIQNLDVVENDSYISFSDDSIVFVYNESIITTYAGECTLTPGIWFYGMQTDSYEFYIKNYNMTFLLEGELKKLPSQFVDYMPGKKLEGETLVVSIAQTGSDGYLEQVDNVEKIAEEGSEIFNDYENNKATGEFSHSEGTETMAVETGAHAEGAGTKALGYAAHAEGNRTTALGNGSHSEGIRSITIGAASHAEGYETEANGERGHTEGANTKTARGTNYGHAEGYYTEANGQYASHAEGYYTKASSNYQHVQGKFNIEDTEEKYAHIVGNGTANANRKNAHTLDWEGNAWFQGNVSVDGTPTNDNNLVTKKYVDDNKDFIHLTGTTENPIVLTDLELGRYLVDGPVKFHSGLNAVNIQSKDNYQIIIGMKTASSIRGTVMVNGLLGRFHYNYNTQEWFRSDFMTRAEVLTLTNYEEYIPTGDYHPATKKYVDDVAANKVDVVEGKALVNTGEIARLSKVDNYNDAEVRGLIEDLSESKADATSIPTKVSQLTNDSGFLTAVPDTYATQAYVTDAINKAQLDGSDSEIDLSPYALTSDLALKADKTELHEHENQTILNSITVEHLTSMAEISDTLNGPKNYYNPEMITESVYLNSDGRLLANTTYFTTDYIPIAPGQTLYFYGANGRYDVQPNARFVGFFDAGKNFITGSRVENVNQITNTYENGAYIKVTMANGGWGLGYIENVYPGVDIKYGEIPESKLWEKPQKIDVFLPDDIYCTVGTTIELYNNQVCLQADKLHLNWCCDYGNAMKRKFSFEGTSALAGQIIPVTLEIYNDYNVLKYTKTIQIHVVAATITNPITCVPIGDSWTNQKPWPAEVINLSGEKVSFVGKFTATVKDANGNWREYNHEGRSGFSAYSYDGANAYTFGDAGEDTYHAFYNPTTARFDWNNYVNTVLGGTQPGAVILQMGINGIAADNTGMVGHEVNMINLIRQDNADIPIFVTLPAYKGNQDGLGIQESSDGHAYHKGVYDYLEKQKVMNYCSLLYEACKDMVGVYFIPLNVCFDSEYNYGAQEVPVNPRATSIIEKIPMEAVHPQDYGYYQMADIVYSVICGNLS